MTEDVKPETEPKSVARRQFLKSIFGLGGALEVAQAEPSMAAVPSGGLFYWADLSVGNIGFPSGLHVPHARAGSVMKLITAACLLEEGSFNPNETEECTGTVHIGTQSFHCQGGHGLLTIDEAIGRSCNCFFAKATAKVGPMAIIEYAERFGFNTPVAGFKCGAFPSKATYPTQRYALGLADDMQPNALQLLRLAAIFGLDGQVPPLKNAAMVDGASDLKPFQLNLRDTTFRRIKKGMVMACAEGTAQQLDPEHKLKIAAKTGTVPYGKKFESWVIGYFPNDNPKYAFCLYAPVGTSKDSAVPQAKNMLYSVEWPK